MKSYRSDLLRRSFGLFSSDIGYGDFFTYVGNRVSLEQAIAVFGLLSPDFIERDDHIFWHPNIETYAPEKFPLVGFRRSASGELEKSYARTDVERYRNNFSVSQLFNKWEETPDEAAFMVGISERNRRLCHIFSEEIAKHWRAHLRNFFPNRTFEFEIDDDILDEYGVCLTFWQS